MYGCMKLKRMPVVFLSPEGERTESRNGSLGSGVGRLAPPLVGSPPKALEAI